MRPPNLLTRPPTQLASKAPQFSVSAFNTKTSSLPVPCKPPLSASVTASASCTHADNVVQCFSCRRRGHYASERTHCTLALEHKPMECEDEIVEPEGSYEDLVEVKNSILLGDSHLSVGRSLSPKPVLSHKWKRTTIFHTLVRCGDTSMKMVINGGSTMNVVARSTIKRCNLTIEPHPHPFKVAWVDKTNLTVVSHRCKVPIRLEVIMMRSYAMPCPWMLLTFC